MKNTVITVYSDEVEYRYRLKMKKKVEKKKFFFFGNFEILNFFFKISMKL